MSPLTSGSGRHADVAANDREHRHGYTCEQAEREIDLQMASKLEAQQALRLICEAIDQPLDKLADGWGSSLPIILTRIETIVDEAERAFRERDATREALHRCRSDFHAKVIALQRRLAERDPEGVFTKPREAT